MKNDHIVEDIIDKQFEIAGLDLSYKDILYVKEWYLKYTYSTEQSKKWEQWVAKYLEKKMKLTKKTAQREASWFSLMYGLKIKD